MWQDNIEEGTNQIVLTKRNTKYLTVRTISKSNIKIVERGTINTTNTQTHDNLIAWLGTGT
jgi:hypothetical protein